MSQSRYTNIIIKLLGYVGFNNPKEDPDVIYGYGEKDRLV